MAEALFIGGSHDGEWRQIDDRASYALEDRTLYVEPPLRGPIPPEAPTYEIVRQEIYERATVVGDVVIYKIQSMTVKQVLERLVQAYVSVAELSDNRS